MMKELRKIKDVFPEMYPKEKAKWTAESTSDYGFFGRSVDGSSTWLWYEFIRDLNKSLNGIPNAYILRQMGVALYSKISEKYISTQLDFYDRFPSSDINYLPDSWEIGDPGLLKMHSRSDTNPWSNPQWGQIRTYINTKYFTKWSHELELLKLKYDPIANYDRTETHEVTETLKGTRTDDFTSTSTDTMNSTGTQTSNSTADSTSSDAVSAYNTSAYQNDKKNETTGTSETRATDTNESTNTNEGTNRGTSTDDKSTTRSETINAKGNIGVTTTQQMMTSEIEFWMWNFLNGVIDDVISELTLDIYD